MFNSSYKIPEKKEAEMTVIKVVNEGIHNNSKFFIEVSFPLFIKKEATNNAVKVILKNIKIF